MYNQKSDQNEFELHLLSKRSNNKLYTDSGASPRTAGQFSNQEPQVYCREDSSGQESLAFWDKEKACYVCKVPENNLFTKTNQGEEFVRCRKTYTKNNNPQKDEEGSVRSRASDAGEQEKTVFKSLSFIDRYLSVWIISAMLVGVILGYFTNISAALDTTKIDTVSLPIAIGLWLMMWPVLCKVRYELLGQILTQPGVWRQVVASLSLNWIVGPLLMTILAWITLSDLPEYRNGLVLVGVARCIAMVLIWNQLAKGHPEYCAILVAINSIMQIVLYAPLALFYLKVVSQQGGEVDINFWDVGRSVMIFLGAPFFAGIVAQYGVIYVKGKDWFNKKFIPMISPIALIALIYTILILFALQGNEVIQNIGNVVRVSIPMCLYFMVMWAGTVMVIRKMHGTYEQTITQAFTAASNNFELAIAIAVGTFGAKSKEALAATVGPLIEVPALLLLVHVALWLKKKLSWSYS